MTSLNDDEIQTFGTEEPRSAAELDTDQDDQDTDTDDADADADTEDV